MEEILNGGKTTNGVVDILNEEDNDDGDVASDAEESEQRNVKTQKLSHILGVCTNFH